MQKDRVSHASAGVLFVTGGSRGIGAAVASMAARAGYDVALCYRERADQAAAVVADIESVGARALALQVDLSNLDAVVQAFEKIDEFGRLSVLVNNAGIIGARLRLQDLELAMLEQVMKEQLLKVMLDLRPSCCCEVLRSLWLASSCRALRTLRGLRAAQRALRAALRALPGLRLTCLVGLLGLPNGLGEGIMMDIEVLMLPHLAPTCWRS